jgi:hypothetical protein
MRYKLTLPLILALVALVALAWPTPAKRSAAATNLIVGVDCIFLGRNRDECHADVSGGTGTYTYQWSPQPLSGGGAIAIIGCPGTAQQTIAVSVTDSNGNTGSFSGVFQCCGSCAPQ